MAVAAQEGAIELYALKSMETMREELRKGLSLNPIKEVRIGILYMANDQADNDNPKGKIDLDRGLHTENGIPASAPQ